MTTVLLAEDDEFFMKPLRYALEDEGYRVLPAETIDSLKQDAPKADVLVIDARMSDNELAGVACAAELIRNRVVSLRVPLIFISVLSEHDDVCQQEIRKHSELMDRYMWLQKYFETDLLLETIREDLQQRSQVDHIGP